MSKIKVLAGLVSSGGSLLACKQVSSCCVLTRPFLSIFAPGVSNSFFWGHISLVFAFKGPNVILGLYKCNQLLNQGQGSWCCHRVETRCWAESNKAEGQIWPMGLVFTTCDLCKENESFLCFFLFLQEYQFYPIRALLLGPHLTLNSS